MNILENTRIKNKLNKSEMAKRLRIGKSYYSMVTNGKREVSKNIALRLESEFGVPLDVSLRPQVHDSETLSTNPPATTDPGPAA